MECSYCKALIQEEYDFWCLECGFGPMCDACYYDHCVGGKHVYGGDHDEEEKQ